MADLMGMLQAAAGGGVTPAQPYDISAATFNGSPLRIGGFNGYFGPDITSVYEDILFNSDGTKVYLSSDNAGMPSVLQFSLPTAYSFANPTLEKILALPMNTCTGMAFGDSGTKFYVGPGIFGTDAVWQYSLSTAYDLRTATPAFNNDDFGALVAATGAYFKSDGLTLYTCTTSDYVYQYSLSTAWDIRTLSFVKRIDIAAQDITNTGIFFKPDGTKMYVTGTQNDSVYEYSLSIAWDISTLSYTTSFSTSAQDTNPQDLFFKSDGTKMYVMGATNDSVYEYALSTAWDISSASYTTSFSVSAQEATPNGLFFKPDGTKMYVTGTSGDGIDEYTLSTAWDISTASATSFFSAPQVSPVQCLFNDDGSVLYFAFANIITQQDVSTPYDVSTTTAWAAQTTGYFNVNAQEATVNAIAFKSDGTKMYVMGATGDDVNEYALSTAWDITTASFTTSFSVATQDTTPRGLFFKSDGTKMYMCGNSSDQVHEYALSTAWDVSSASYTTSAGFASTANPSGIFFSSDGTKLAVQFTSENIIYDLSTAWDISSKSTYATTPTTNAFNITPQDGVPNGIFFKPNGSELYLIGGGTDSVYQYTLSTAFDITTASLTNSFSISSQTTQGTTIAFKTDGTAMYIAEWDFDSVLEYTLSTAWDISTASYTRSFSIASQTSTPRGTAFKSDGTKMYIVSTGEKAVFEYSLSTAWNISTASYTTSFSIVSQDSAPWSIAFKPDGTAMYIAGTTTDEAYEYALSTAWDVSTASYVQSSNFAGTAPENINGVIFNNDGTKLYMIATNDTSFILELDIT